ncbi:MAG: hypothetical protein FJX16_12785, partial [Alphaproteobacteria bacterium]|nr:hypothetical protein [Alphaproteobacteria bacterium]
MTEQLMFLRVQTRAVVARPLRVQAASLGANSGSRMSQRENQHDNPGPCRDAESDVDGAVGSGGNDVDGSGVDGAMLDPKIQAQLGRVFRAYCDDLIHQPIP